MINKKTTINNKNLKNHFQRKKNQKMLFMGHSLFVKSHKNSNLLLFSFCFLLTVHCLITELSESHDCFCTEALSAPACMVLELHEHQGKQSLKNYVYCAGYLFWSMAKVSAEMSTINLDQKKCLKIPWLKNVLHLKFQSFKVLRVYIHVNMYVLMPIPAVTSGEKHRPLFRSWYHHHWPIWYRLYSRSAGVKDLFSDTQISDWVNWAWNHPQRPRGS